MATQKAEKNNTPAVQGSEDVLVRMSGTETLNSAAVLKMLKKATVGEEISLDYKKWEIGESLRAVVVGITQIQNKKKEMQDAIKLFTADAENVITADVALVSSLRPYAQQAQSGGISTAVQIDCTGEKDSSNGTYKTFKVNRLNVE